MKRNEQIDALKSILIVLMIWGHIVMEHKEYIINLAIHDFIYSFHMPLFVFLSGYFSSKKDWKGFFRTNQSIVISLIIFQIVCIGIEILKHSHISWATIFTPAMSLWYLSALLIWRLILQLGKNSYLERPVWLVTISCAVSILLPHSAISPVLGINKVVAFMPYFFLGFSLKSCDWFSKITRIPYIIAGVVIILTSCLLYLFSWSSTFVSTNYLTKNVITIAFATVNSITFIRLIVPLLNYRTLQIEGGNTLYYYIYQNYLGIIKRAICNHLSISCNSIVCLLFLAVNVGILYFLRNNYFLKKPLYIKLLT